MSVDKFEQKLREKFEAVSIPPSPELWGNIESQIPQKDKKRGVIWFWTGGLSVAACLLVWLWLSNAAIPVSSTQDANISKLEDGNLPDQANESEGATITPFEANLAENEATAPANDLNNQSDAISAPKLVQGMERVAVRTPNIERSATQLPSNAEIQNDPQGQYAEITAKVFSLKTINREIIETPIISNPKDRWLAGWCEILSIPTDNWWQALPEIEESVPRWAINLQAGQDLIRNGDVSFGNADPIALVNSKAANDDLLNTADYVQFARNPSLALADEGVDQATLVSYPTQESRVKIVGEYQLQGNWSLRTGLGLGISNQGGLTQANVIYGSAASPDPLADGEWTYNQGPGLKNLQLEVPLTIQYRIKRAKGAFVLGSGLSFNQNLNNLSQARYSRDGFATNASNREVFSVSDQANAGALNGSAQSLAYRNWNSFVLLQAQYEKPISSRFALYGGPSFKYMLNDIFVGSLASRQAPIRLGLTAGIRFGR